MKATDLLCSRRSIRKYTSQEVSEEIISEILKTGMYAPSARDQRPWHYLVIRNKETLQAITNIHPFSSMLHQAAAAIVVCADINLEQSEGYWVQDCASTTLNMLQAIHALGLGGVWLGVHPREERSNGIVKLFGLPENIKPFSIISFGYPDETKPLPDRTELWRIHNEKW